MVTNRLHQYYSWVAKKLNRINKKRLHDADENIVYFVSFPKSGRTWLQLMMARIYSDLTGHNVELFLGSDKDLLRNKVKPYPFLRVGHGYQNAGISQGDDFPQGYYTGKKVILMVRDPRDVVVSHYYHEKYHYNCFDGSISEFIRYKYDKNQPDSGKRKARFGIIPIINYMNAWQKNIHVLEQESFSAVQGPLITQAISIEDGKLYTH